MTCIVIEIMAKCTCKDTKISWLIFLVDEEIGFFFTPYLESCNLKSENNFYLIKICSLRCFLRQTFEFMWVTNQGLDNLVVQLLSLIVCVQPWSCGKFLFSPWFHWDLESGTGPGKFKLSNPQSHLFYARASFTNKNLKFWLFPKQCLVNYTLVLLFFMASKYRSAEALGFSIWNL